MTANETYEATLAERAAPAESSDGRVSHPTPAERTQSGKASRENAPRASLAALDLPADRDPVAYIEEQSSSRIPELVPIRYGRMLVSPFTFYRGAANIMAHDLATAPRTGLTVQLCGDAHLSNFGGFAAPDRTLVFSVNDFDETLPGPFEWDVKRLVASFEVAGRERGFSDAKRRRAVLSVGRTYREAMHQFATARNLDVWYARLTAAQIEQGVHAEGTKKQAKDVRRAAAKAHTKDSMKALAKLTHVVDGEVRIKPDPPLIVPIAELVGDADGERFEREMREVFRMYRHSLQADRGQLLEDFRDVDLARKVVGVGSVGTRDFILLLLGRDDQDPLFLQIKEAVSSVLEPFLGRSKFRNHGQRAVEGQRMMQASSDIFLGWVRTTKGGRDGVRRDYYVRQLWDWKMSVDIEALSPKGLEFYAEICGWSLARAHARSGDPIAMASYLGKSDVFERAMADFATAYADLNEHDYDAFAQAVRDGRIKAETGI